MPLPRDVAGGDPNLVVVWGRAEEQAPEQFGVAVAKALAQPPTAAEWCLPLVREGGPVVLWVGEGAERGRSPRLREARRERSSPPGGAPGDPQDGPDADGFPRRTGVAKKRPLA